jgi:hypothetical protein
VTELCTIFVQTEVFYGGTPLECNGYVPILFNIIQVITFLCSNDLSVSVTLATAIDAIIQNGSFPTYFVNIFTRCITLSEEINADQETAETPRLFSLTRCLSVVAIYSG